MSISCPHLFWTFKFQNLSVFEEYSLASVDEEGEEGEDDDEQTRHGQDRLGAGL